MPADAIQRPTARALLSGHERLSRLQLVPGAYGSLLSGLERLFPHHDRSTRSWRGGARLARAAPGPSVGRKLPHAGPAGFCSTVRNDVPIPRGMTAPARNIRLSSAAGAGIRRQPSWTSTSASPVKPKGGAELLQGAGAARATARKAAPSLLQRCARRLPLAAGPCLGRHAPTAQGLSGIQCQGPGYWRSGALRGGEGQKASCKRLGRVVL